MIKNLNKEVNMNERRYELMFIVSSKLGEDQREKSIKEVEDLLASLGAQSVQKEVWGDRKLAYPILKETNGYYVIINFNMAGDKLMEIEKKMNAREDLLRFMVIKDEKEKFMKKNKIREERKKIRLAERSEREQREGKVDEKRNFSKFNNDRRRDNHRRSEGGSGSDSNTRDSREGREGRSQRVEKKAVEVVKESKEVKKEAEVKEVKEKKVVVEEKAPVKEEPKASAEE